MNGFIEELNFHNDARTRAQRDERGYTVLSERLPTLRIQFSDDLVEAILEAEAQPADWDGVLEVSFKYEVCPFCEGRGKHVNPSIDSNGLTSEDFDDRDFAEDYAEGAYDVTCYECHGKKVVPEIVLPTKIQEILDDWCESNADYRRVEMAERMSGA